MEEKTGGLEGIYNSLGKVLKAFIFGESKRLQSVFIKLFRYRNLKSLDAALEKAISIALEKKLSINILLSPASASFDQFKILSKEEYILKNS